MNKFSGDYSEMWKRGTVQEFMYFITGYQCEHCGMEFVHGTTKAKTERNANGKPVILTIHHLDGNKANMSWRNLLSCCQRCHLKIQGLWQPGGTVTSRLLDGCWLVDGNAPRWLTMRELPYVAATQLNLFEVAE